MNHMAYTKNGDGSQAVLIAFSELPNQFTKNGIIFERIQFALDWWRIGNSGGTKKVLPTMNRLGNGI